MLAHHPIGIVILIAFGCLTPPATTRPEDEAFARFERLVQDLREAGEPIEAQSIKVWSTLSDSHNGARVLTEVAEEMADRLRAGVLIRLRKELPNYRVPLADSERVELRALLDDRREFIERLDRLDEVPGFDWGDPPTTPLLNRPDAFGLLARISAAALLLRLDAIEAIDSGDVSRVLDRARQLDRIAEAVSMHPDSAAIIAGNKIHTMAADLAIQLGRTNLLAELAEEQRRQVSALTQTMLDEATVRARLEKWLNVQRIVAIDTCRAMRAGTVSPKQLFASDVVGRLAERRGYLETHPEEIIEVFSCAVAGLEEASTMSRAEVFPKVKKRFDALMADDFAAGQILRLLGPDIDTVTHMTFEAAGERKLAAAALAIALYRADHGGAWPPSLDDVVPKYLPEAPHDPTSRQPAKVRYRVSDHEAILWIAGDNGKDDDGFEATPGMNPRERREKTDRVVHLRPPPHK